jgi:surface protein
MKITKHKYYMKKNNKIALIVLLSLFFGRASAQDFITRWNLATTGSGATQLSIGTATSGTVSYSWTEVSPGTASGSGTFSGATLTITGLPTGATIRLRIQPTNFQRIIVGNGADRNRLLDVEQWGTTAWTSMQNAFFGCSNLNISATDIPILTSVTRMDQMFQGCSSLNGPTNINSWNTSAVTVMVSAFLGASSFNQNIGSWNTANVVSMRNMFSNASSFNQNIGGWNTANVSDMRGMFGFASAFNQNLGNWTLNSNVDMTSDMLGNCGMNCANYAATLIGWNATGPNGRTLGATGRNYGSQATSARANWLELKDGPLQVMP